MSVSSAPAASPVRNPGPSWGYHFLRTCDRVVPEAIFRPARALGTWIALLAMPAQRRHSRAYLRIIFAREPTHLEIFRHFFAFEESLMLKLRVANGRPHRTLFAQGSGHFQAFLQSGQPALFGTFHIGHSDLVGFILGVQEKRRVAMIRQRVGNSHDTDQLSGLFGRWISIIWSNESDNLIFALKKAVAAGDSIALKCDRLEFSAKTEPFHFLGARRQFPFTIYYLALIFNLPVLLSIGVPAAAKNESEVHCAPLWLADPALNRRQNLALAREHFQSFLGQVEALLRAHPYWWFNFIEMSPEVAAA